MASTLAPAAVLPAQAAVAGMSAVDPQNGFPTWYSDGTVKLQLCYMAGAGCLSEPPDPGAPASYPNNFPEEAFWFDAQATGGNLGLYEAALEGAHVNGPVVPGEQMGFGRLRFVVDNLRAGASYTIKHPYGENTFVADRDPKVATRGRIKATIDAGVCAPTRATPCDWAGVGEAFLGPDAATTTSTFLRQVGAPAGTLGDINTPRAVTGAPSGLNAVTITGPDAGGPGVDSLTVSQFTVQGLIFNGADAGPSTPDLAAASDSGRSASDNITNVPTPTLTGTVPGTGANEATVELLVDGAVAGETTTLGGAYVLQPAAALPSGVHRVSARTPNPAYSVNPATGLPVGPNVPQYLTSGTLTFTVDTTPPPVSIAAPRPSNPSADTTPTVGFSVGEAGATTECRLLPSNPDWQPNCVSPMSYDPQLDGSYTFDVRATDVAGNVGVPATVSWRIGPPDTTPPTVLSQSPTANQTRVPLANNVTVKFSEAVTGVDAASMVLDGPAGTPVPATVTYNAATLTATLDPTESLASGTRYTLSLSNAIQDVSGNLYPGSTSTFTTVDTIAPTLSSRTPGGDATGVPVTADVTATFDEAVTGVGGTTFTLVDPAGTAVPAAVRYDAVTRTATLDPAAELRSGTTYTAGLSGGITDTSANPMAPATWSFTTVVDATPPTVSARTPAVNAAAVSQTSNLTATFSEPVTGVGATTFTLKNAATGAAVGATSVTYNPTTRVATFDPNVTLAADTRYTATLTKAIKDAAGLALPATSWTFTTGPAPTVSARTPGSNATGVSQTGNITATFSEPVTGVGAATFTLRKAATGAAVGATSVTYNRTSRVATFDPKVTLAADTRYTATLTTGIRDAGGNPIPATTWTFTTGPRPTVATRTPAVNATRVGRTANITTTFSEAVAGVGTSTFKLKKAATGAAVAATVARNGTTNQWVLNPGVRLAASTKYTVTLTGGATAIRDNGGNPLGTTSWSFTTGTS